MDSSFVISLAVASAGAALYGASRVAKTHNRCLDLSRAAEARMDQFAKGMLEIAQSCREMEKTTLPSDEDWGSAVRNVSAIGARLPGQVRSQGAMDGGGAALAAALAEIDRATELAKRAVSANMKGRHFLAAIFLEEISSKISAAQKAVKEHDEVAGRHNDLRSSAPWLHTVSLLAGGQ